MINRCFNEVILGEAKRKLDQCRGSQPWLPIRITMRANIILILQIFDYLDYGLGIRIVF